VEKRSRPPLVVQRRLGRIVLVRGEVDISTADLGFVACARHVAASVVQEGAGTDLVGAPASGGGDVRDGFKSGARNPFQGVESCKEKRWGEKRGTYSCPYSSPAYL
jgi:hypothetical protein